MKNSILFILLVWLLQACTKNLSDARPGNLPTYNDIANSSTRIVLARGFDCMVDTTKLTNFLPYNVILTQSPPNGTPWFPTAGATTDPFFIPQEFIDSKGQATVKLYNRGVGGGSMDSFVVQDDYAQPNDYYIPGGESGGFGDFGVVRVPRPQQTLADPSHIRIRLLNLVTDNGNPLTLAYANGAPVSNTTSHIGFNAWSDYIELPYGSYDFRVLDDSIFGSQLHARPPAGVKFNLEVNSATNPNYAIGGGQYYSPTITFQPGGVYTIVASVFGTFEDPFAVVETALPGFAVITDNTPATNMQYARIQAVNSSVANGMSLQIDNGQSIAVTYGKASDYQILTSGSHAIKINDGSGNLLAEQAITLSGGDNLSLWTYADADGKTSILPVSNNMGGIEQSGTNNDGSDPSLLVYDPLNFNMIVQTRFLNLCADIPYVTFTGTNGLLFLDNRFSVAKAAQNLAAGSPADPVNIPYPYVDLGAGSYNTVEAYASQPNVVPGNRLMDVTPLPTTAFTALPAAYYSQDAPSMEPGVYTVALIGRNNGTQTPQLIVVKHNK